MADLDEIMLAALAEAGYPQGWIDGGICFLPDDTPPCAIAHKAFTLALSAAGCPPLSFDEWHAAQAEVFCDCGEVD